MTRIDPVGPSPRLSELLALLRRERAASPGAQPAPQAPPALPVTSAGDEEDHEQRIAHFLSHVDASCFVSLLQIQDPLPLDERDRPEYRRRYRRIHEALEVPPPPGAVTRSIG